MPHSGGSSGRNTKATRKGTYLLSQERKLESHHAERRIKHFHEKIRKFALAANEAAKKEDKKPKGDVVFLLRRTLSKLC